jgi:Zn-finger nucleic acid-binding protein
MCPVCKEPLVAFELEGIEIDHCVSCFGTWLDAGELKSITEAASVSTGELGRSLELSGKGKRTRLRCPRCPSKLREISIGREPAVLLDRCPNGHGLWFDRGEMAGAILSFAGKQRGAVAAFFADLYKSEIETAARGE